MSPTADYAPSAAGPDELIPDPIVFREMNISAMSGWRWDRDPAMAELGWLARVRIRGRNYRSRQALEAFKANLLRRAIAQRNQKQRT